MHIKSTIPLSDTDYDQAERLGIFEGLSRAEGIKRYSQAIGTRQKLLNLIEDRKIHMSNLAHILAEAKLWDIPEEQTRSHFIADLKTAIRHQKSQYGVTQFDDSICQVSKCVAVLPYIDAQIKDSFLNKTIIPSPVMLRLLDLASLTWRYSELVYRDNADTLISNADYTDKFFLSNASTDTQVLMFVYDRYAFVTFRGTEPDNLKDWWIDAQLWRSRRKSPPRHAGFNKAWKSVEEGVRQWLETQINNGVSGVILTGHSLGGALAKLAALDLHQTIPINAVITFGAPPAGMTQSYVSAYSEELESKTWRFEHETDIVTWISPRSLKYRHVGNRVAVSYGKADIHGRTSSTREERFEKRGHIKKDILETNVKTKYETIGPDGKQLSLTLRQMALNFFPTFVLYAVCAYAIYKVLSFFHWKKRTLSHDISHHTMQKKYGWSLDSYSTSLTKSMKDVVAIHSPDSRKQTREFWLKIGDNLNFNQPEYLIEDRKFKVALDIFFDPNSLHYKNPNAIVEDPEAFSGYRLIINTETQPYRAPTFNFQDVALLKPKKLNHDDLVTKFQADIEKQRRERYIDYLSHLHKTTKNYNSKFS